MGEGHWGRHGGRSYRGADTLEGTPDFAVSAPYSPTGDQPRAIAELAASITRGDRNQTLLGATGTGKTHTMARVIEKAGARYARGRLPTTLSIVSRLRSTSA